MMEDSQSVDTLLTAVKHSKTGKTERFQGPNPTDWIVLILITSNNNHLYSEKNSEFGFYVCFLTILNCENIQKSDVPLSQLSYSTYNFSLK